MRELDADLGGPVHYADFGGAGSPLVFVHGLSGSIVGFSVVVVLLIVVTATWRFSRHLCSAPEDSVPKCPGPGGRRPLV